MPTVSPAANHNPVSIGTLVQFTANPSDSGCGACIPLFTYQWKIISAPSGSSATLSNQNIQNPTITPDVAGSYQISVIATDSVGQSSAPGFVTVNACGANSLPFSGTCTPISITAPSTDTVGSPVDLSCGNSLLSEPLTYSWRLTSVPSGSAPTLSSTSTQSIKFTPLVVGTYDFSCQVTDTSGDVAVASIGTAVIKASTTTTVSSSLNPSTVGQSVTLTATVSSDSTIVPTGTVTFFEITGVGHDTLVPLGTATLDSTGKASIDISSLPTGNQFIKVVYNGDTNFESSFGGLTQNVVPVPISPTITAPSTITSGKSYSASVSARPGMTYLWSITGGTINGNAAGTLSSDGTTNSISFTAGLPGPLTLSAIETNAAGDRSAPGTASINVVAAPVTPIITAPTKVTSGKSYIASLPTHKGATYAWTVSTPGTITSPGGNSGVFSLDGTTNSITFVPITGVSPGTFTITASEINAAGDTSAPGSINGNVFPPPVTPTIVGPSNLVTGTTGTYQASVPVATGMTFLWTISSAPAGSSPTLSDPTAQDVTFTSTVAGNFVLSVIEKNGAGDSSAAATFPLTVKPVPPVITSPVDGAFLNTNTPTVSGTAAGGTKVTVTFDAIAEGNIDADPTLDTWSIVTDSRILDGKHTIEATAEQNGVQSDPSNIVHVTIDTVPPKITINSVSSSNANAGFARAGDTFTIRFTASDDTGLKTFDVEFLTHDITFTCSQNPALVFDCTYTVQRTDPDGPAVITVTGTDLAGNTATLTQTSSILIDNTPPTINPPPNVTVISRAPTAVSIGTPTVSDDLDPSPIVTNNAPALFPIGTTTVIWTATDHAGNSATANQFVIVITPAQATENLITTVKHANLDHGTTNSLVVKLTASLSSLTSGNNNAAENQLSAFINEVKAQSGIHISTHEADIFIAAASAVLIAESGH